MKTLFVGPFAKDFGWELCWFNPIARLKAREYDRVIVSAPATSQYLYEFATEFHGHDLDMSAGEHNAKQWEAPNVIKREDWVYFPWSSAVVDDYIRKEARKLCYTPQHEYAFDEREWRDLRPSKSKHIADVMLAFRPLKEREYRKGQHRMQYPYLEELVARLKAEGFSVAFYGGPSNLFVQGAIDFRGTPLKEQCAALAGAKIAIGPSSGPIHLASLCYLPHICWYMGDHIALRYEVHWNPFEVPCRYYNIDSEGDPTPLELLSEVEHLIS